MMKGMLGRRIRLIKRILRLLGIGRNGIKIKAKKINKNFQKLIIKIIKHNLMIIKRNPRMLLISPIKMILKTWILVGKIRMIL